jgi:anthranilate synthase component 2
MHGKTSRIYHNRRGIFKNMPNPFVATRYHSLVVSRKKLPAVIEVIAWERQDKEIMGLRHRDLPLWGVQFHPESILTKTGKIVLSNFLKIKTKRTKK